MKYHEADKNMAVWKSESLCFFSFLPRSSESIFADLDDLESFIFFLVPLTWFSLGQSVVDMGLGNTSLSLGWGARTCWVHSFDKINHARGLTGSDTQFSFSLCLFFFLRMSE